MHHGSALSQGWLPQPARASMPMARYGGWLPFAALTAIHYMHRLMAYVVLAGLAWLVM